MSQIIKTDQIIQLYKHGYFPMADSAESNDIKFYKPEKRFIIPIKKFHIPKKLFNEFKKNKYKFLINNNFLSTINNCSKPRKNDKGTWINKVIKDLYLELFNKGIAKSIECYDGDKLIGGLYGIHIGGCFFGESMFSKVSNASKFCLIYLINILKLNNFILLDSQFYNPHLLQFGAYEILDIEYQSILKKGINKKCKFTNSLGFQKSFSILQSLTHKS